MSHKDPTRLANSLNFELNIKSFSSGNIRKKNKIERVKETVFLRVVLDEHLSWKPHISRVACKISKSVGVT